ncbi:multidrug ABC transporter ATP-binding protein [Corynebacterium sp. HMSC077D10]|uniref:ABC transporter ATP-binding protein n=1 Tax=unclassified Corynebacterium TaxID=2624378 RepID=UPI000797473C|nr:MULTISPECIES: ABC transporter ATP-binding protein [unclassified Corynebacterium]KXB55088.1 ABC transporter, ATP-binding protein [Corynebacterium sp. DNF00584]OFP19303.1 multidrug ABC transporter ATP-binding protein [Corynebacterium sp. HMSC065A05]OFP65197.1 multidrug ABC transporter ATP-binding protein [Corynebacterium sp. HMSC077D10]
MELIKLIGRYAKPYTWQILAVLALQAISTAATLYLPSLNADIIDQGVAQGDVPYIWTTGRVMLAVAFVQVIAAVIAVWFGARSAMGLGRDIRAMVFRRVARYSAEDMGHFGTPTLITRGTNDVQQVQMTFMMTLNFMVSAPIMAIGGIIMAMREDAGLSWLVWVSVAVLLGVISALIAKLMPLFRVMQDKLDAINGTLREQITGIRVVRAFVREAHETERFTEANEDITQLSLKIGNLFVTMFPIITVILNVATGAVLWFGGHRVDDGLVAVGSLTAFLQYLMQILAAVMMGTFMAMMLPRAIICAKRITEVLNRAPSIVEPEHPIEPAHETGEVEFDNVTFSYAGADAPVLENVSFTAHPGQTTAIIGATGSGKTTLLSLIPRLYLPTQGQVRIDGVATSDLAREGIVKRVALVPQKPYLFSGTVASNLRTGAPDATDEELWDALKVAQANFVTDLDMPIAQGGTNVSGGQRQRLSIARMLVAKPKVYLFDDSFSALDVITDAKVREAMRSYTADATTIIVAQRVSSIENADQILVMEAGRVVAKGTHAQLLETSPTYREIVESQATVEA